jgi:predicted methyltransferase
MKLLLSLITAGVLAGCATAPESLPRERIDALLASSDRSAGDRFNDQRRKPAEMLAFIGVRPGMTALDVSAARGYTTELIARAVGPTGQVYGQVPPARQPSAAPPAQPEGAAAPPPPGTPPPLPTFAERMRNPALAHMRRVERPFDDPVPPEAEGKLDLVTLMFNYHDFGHLGVDRARTNAAIFRALKPGGMYVIADHAGRDGTGIGEAGTLHRVEEAFVIREVEAAGFKLAARGDFLRNPNDPRDKNTPVPPVPKDEFVLKFVKPR